MEEKIEYRDGFGAGHKKPAVVRIDGNVHVVGHVSMIEPGIRAKAAALLQRCERNHGHLFKGGVVETEAEDYYPMMALVVAPGGEVVAASLFNLGARCAYLTVTYVDPRYRRQGINLAMKRLLIEAGYGPLVLVGRISEETYDLHVRHGITHLDDSCLLTYPTGKTVPAAQLAKGGEAWMASQVRAYGEERAKPDAGSTSGLEAA